MKTLIAPVALAAFMLTASARPPAETTVHASEASFRQGPGSRIAFTRLREDVDRPGSDFHFDAEIWIMNGDGSEPTRLTHNTTDDLGAVWSPDARTIAFHGIQWSRDLRGRLVPGSPHLFLVDVESGMERPLLTDQGELVRGRFPSWSPNGGKIAFDSGGDSSSNIFVINPDGTGLEQLTHDLVFRNIRPDWSPDGRKIAFVSRPDEITQINVINADGSDPAPLTDQEFGNANAPDWSPDGHRIVFQSSRDSPDDPRINEIYVMNADGTDRRRLTNREQDATLPSSADPDWSPEGRMIAFQRDSAPRQINQLFIVSADGGEPMSLTALPSANGHPAWSRGRAVKP